MERRFVIKIIHLNMFLFLLYIFQNLLKNAFQVRCSMTIKVLNDILAM